MSSIDSKADFVALLDELRIPEALQTWLKEGGFETVSDLTFTFIQSLDGEALISKIPGDVWQEMKVDPAEAATSVIAGRVRRLLAQGRVLVTQSQSAASDPAALGGSTPMAAPSWQEHAPPRLTPEAVVAMTATFSKNFPGELLTPDTTPSIRLLSIVHHQLRPGQSLKYIPWQIRLSQKQYQDMMEAKTHKAVRSEAQLLGVFLDDTPEISMDQVRLSSEWLLKVQQVFRNAFVMCGAAHLHTFKKFDQKVFDLAMKKFAPESNLRAVTMPELLEADKSIWAEIIALVSQNWSLDDALHELSSARADLYGLLQPRPRANVPAAFSKGAPRGSPKPVVKSALDKKPPKSSGANGLCTFIVQNNEKRTLCQRFQSGRCSSKSCKYQHLCAVKLDGGKPCGKQHSAADHPNLWLDDGRVSKGLNSLEKRGLLEGQSLESFRPMESPPGHFFSPSSGRFFVSLFQSQRSPFGLAATDAQVDAIFPMEDEVGAILLNDAAFEQLLRLAWGSWIAAMWSIPPFHLLQADVSLRQQLGLSVQDIAAIIGRGRQLLRVAHVQGALVTWGAPLTLVSSMDTEDRDLLLGWNATCCQVAQSAWGSGDHTVWLLCSTAPLIQSLASSCSCDGVGRAAGSYSTMTSFPLTFAASLLSIVAKVCSASGQFLTFEALPLVRKSSRLAPVSVCDGAGLTSTADWSWAGAPDVFASLRGSMWRLAQDHGYDQVIVHHLQAGSDSPPLSSQQLAPFMQLFDHWLRQQGFQPSWRIDAGQSFRLNLLHCLSQLTRDPDVGLLPSLQAGVSTGVLCPLQPSGLWPKKSNAAALVQEPLLVHDTNWSSAEEDVGLTQSLIDAEVDNGWVRELSGGMAEAQARWKHLAVGRLNVVKVPNKAPRLVLDSSSCAVNGNCALPESMMMPSVDDLRRAMASSCNIGEFAGLALDIHAAHKQVRLHPDEHGLVLFQFQNRTYHYTVAHFGARFSAWWWQRLGGLLLRLLHQFLHAPHKGWIYVDDILLLLHRTCFVEQVTVTVLFFLLINTPISWRKAQIGDRLTWIGWDLNFYMDTVQLTTGKAEKLAICIHELLQNKQVKVKEFQAVLGMLIWFTSLVRYLRPHLAELYRCLHSPPATLYSVPAVFWKEFLQVLNEDAVVAQSSPSLCLPVGGRVVEYSHLPVQCKADLPLMPYKSSLQWVRVQDLGASTVTLTQDAIRHLQWFKSLLATPHTVFSLHLPTPLVLKAAADAWAEGDGFGIGGWIITSTQIVWFSEQFSLAELKRYMPKLTKDAQKYICAFEILAQLALVMAAARHLRLQHLSVTLPSASDNTAAEAGANKLLTTRWPASEFLAMLGDFAFQQHIHLAVSHTPGQRNEWADDLSRNRVSRWMKYPRCRICLPDFFQIGRRLHLHPSQVWPPDWKELQRKKAAVYDFAPCHFVAVISGAVFCSHVLTLAGALSSASVSLYN